MTTIIERDTSHGTADVSTAVVTIVAIVAILFLVGFTMFAMGIYPFPGAADGTPDTNNPSVNINMEIPADQPPTTPY